jgi:hypothetical protein
MKTLKDFLEARMIATGDFKVVMMLIIKPMILIKTAM